VDTKFRIIETPAANITIDNDNEDDEGSEEDYDEENDGQDIRKAKTDTEIQASFYHVPKPTN
jgi:hypothetical protein